MTEKQTVEVERFSRGEKVPEWLLSFTPTTPGEGFEQPTFSQDCLGVYIAPNRIMIVPLEHTGLILNVRSDNVVSAAATKTVIFPEMGGVVLVGPEDDKNYTRSFRSILPPRS